LAHAREYPLPLALCFVANVATQPESEVVWVGEKCDAAALAMLQDHVDKSYSLCDAISSILMGERGVIKALTTDRHFEQAGPR
jgi:predicted nucleic acid-binding protein